MTISHEKIVSDRKTLSRDASASKNCGRDSATSGDGGFGWQPDGSDHYRAIDQPSLPLIRWSLISWMCALTSRVYMAIYCTVCVE